MRLSALYMHRMFSMRRDPAIDRSKHDVDLLEHVFKGVHTEPAYADRHARVNDLSVRSWAAGRVVAAVQVEVLDDIDDERK